MIAAKSASFIQSFGKLGLVPDSGATWFLPRLVGSARALGLAMLGERLSAADAAAWGLIWRCVDDADFAAAVERLIPAQQWMRSGSPRSQPFMKLTSVSASSARGAVKAVPLICSA